MDGRLLREVSQPHQRSYDDPITLSAGDRIRITKRELWDGIYEWLWCINASDKEGWVPASYLEVQGDRGLVLRDYSAIELTVSKGESLAILEDENGWYWCENAAGDRGWVPVNCFD